MHPRKVYAIKTDVEKQLKTGLIYTVLLNEGISNIVPIKKK